MAFTADRYFINPYQDYDKSTSKIVEINTDYWKKYLFEIFQECMMRMKPKNTEHCSGGIYTGNLGLIFVAYKLLNSNILSNNPDFTSQIKKLYLIEASN